MEKLYKVLNLPRKLGLLGVEVEVEGENLPKIATGAWKYEKDGSLRGESGEYILRNPLNLQKTHEALDDLRKQLAESKLDWSFRTSVHVHVNVGSMSAKQINCFIYTYVLLEELMLHYCGPSRIGNRFCLRIQDAEGLVSALEYMFRSDWNFPMRDEFRYASLNIDALCKFGSLEFRGMRGTLDKERLEIWTEALARIRSFSQKYATPFDIAEGFRNTPDDVWVAKIFGKRIAEKLLEGVEDLSGMLSRNYSLSAMLSRDRSIVPVREAPVIKPDMVGVDRFMEVA